MIFICLYDLYLCNISKSRLKFRKKEISLFCPPNTVAFNTSFLFIYYHRRPPASFFCWFFPSINHLLPRVFFSFSGNSIKIALSHLCHVWFTEIYPKKAVSDGSNLDNNTFQMEVGIFQNLSELKISCVIFKMIAIFVPDLTQLQNWHHSHLMLYIYTWFNTESRW